MADRPDMAEQLDLQPHPEGGWFRETWRSPVMFQPAGYDGERSAATAIYFLLRLGGSGPAPAEATTVTLGGDVASGQAPQVVVTGGTWQSACPAAATPVLVTCIVAPGFDFADFRVR